MEEKNNKQNGPDPEKNEDKINENKIGSDIKPEPDPDQEAGPDVTSTDPDVKKDKSDRPKQRKDEHADELEQEIAKLNDKYLRLYSEFDNYRKRSLKERIELSKTASSEVISNLLPVLDDFERALKSMESGEDKESAIIEGINHVYTKLRNTLSRQGLELMKASGEEFNTDFHEAMTQIPAPTPEQKGKVIDVIQNGYLLNGKVIRYAKVVIGS